MDIFNIKKIKELEEKINNQEEKINNQKKAINDYKNHIADTKKLNIDLSKSLNIQLEENKKLNEWVITILKEFGTTNVREKHVQIPMIDYGTTYTSMLSGTVKEKRIEIPAITLIKREMI